MDIRPVVKGTNRYCGPAVISALTGIDTGEAARLIRKLTGRRQVTGTHLNEVLSVLVLFGIQSRWLYQGNDTPVKERPTLTTWLKQSKDIRTPGRVFLVSAGYHWQLISGRRYVCGITKEVVSIRDKRVKRRARVRTVVEVFKGLTINSY